MSSIADLNKRPYDVTYDYVDIELVPPHFLGSSWPSESIRLQLDGHIPSLALVSSAVLYYYFLVPHVFPATKPKTDEAFASRRRWRNVHNLSLCLYSGLCCIVTAVTLHGRNELFDWENLLCRPVEGTPLRPLSVTFTLSKLLEWADTAFIVWLGRSPPQFLHLYHHATTFWLFCIVMNIPGPEKMGMLLNGFVHFLMYWHYWRPWPKRFVPAITVLQIAQLATVTYAWTVSTTTCPFERFSSGMKEYPLVFWTPYFFVPVFLWLFVVFFVRRFVLRKSKGHLHKDQGKIA